MRRFVIMRNISLFVAALCLLVSSLLVAPPAPAYAADPVSVDERVTSGTNRFTYSGSSWTDCGACNVGAYQNSFKYAYATGDKVVFTFSGVQVKFYGYREPVGGIAAVSVDGKTPTDLNYYSAQQSLVNVYTSPVLTSGTHTVSLTVTGRKAGGSSPTINIDRAVVYTSSTTPTPTPTPTPSPTPTPTPPPPVPSGSGVASITLDDGTSGQYTYARPILNQRGLKATFYIVSDALGWTGTNMNATQVRQLAADGHEIGNHTRDHRNLTTLSSSEITAEFADSQNAIRSQVGITPTSCAYPYGANNSTVQAIAAQYFRGCRGTSGGTNSVTGPARYNLVTFYVQLTTSTASIRSAADQAKANGRWIVFTYHGVAPSAGGPEDVTSTNFAAQMDAIKASGIPVRTVSQTLQ